jgi:hypothetical protein
MSRGNQSGGPHGPAAGEDEESEELAEARVRRAGEQRTVGVAFPCSDLALPQFVAKTCCPHASAICVHKRSHWPNLANRLRTGLFMVRIHGESSIILRIVV